MSSDVLGWANAHAQKAVDFWNCLSEKQRLVVGGTALATTLWYASGVVGGVLRRHLSGDVTRDTGIQRRLIAAQKMQRAPVAGVRVHYEYRMSRSGHLLYCATMEPEKGAVKGLIHYNIGYVDCLDLHNFDVAVNWVKRGYVVFIFDHYGHGRSDGQFARIDDFETLVTDSLDMLQQTKRNVLKKHSLTEKNVFVFGLSMGGAITAQMSKRQPDAFAGMVLIAPMLAISSSKIPHWSVVWLLRQLVAVMPWAKVIPSDSLVEDNSSDSEVIAEIWANPLIYSEKPRLCTAYSFLSVVSDIQTHLDEVKKPFLVMHGTADRMTECKGSMKLYRRAATPPKFKAMKLYKDAWHMLWQEPTSKGTIYEEVEQWMIKIADGL